METELSSASSNTSTNNEYTQYTDTGLSKFSS